MAFALPCVIFAGGKSSRMGRDKALLPFGGYDTLAEYQYRRLLPLFSSVYLSAKTDKFPFEAPVIYDPPELETYAPTAGLLAALETLQRDFIALSVDAPFVDEEIFGALIEAYERGRAPAFVARSPSGPQPLCALYTQKMRLPLLNAVNRRNHRLTRLLYEANAKFVPFKEDAPFFNMNEAAHYQEAMRRVHPKES